MVVECIRKGKEELDSIGLKEIFFWNYGRGIFVIIGYSRICKLTWVMMIDGLRGVVCGSGLIYS